MRDEKIQRAAHLYACYDTWRAIQLATQYEITPDEWAEGVRQAQKEQDERQRLRRRYGNPEYGSYDADA